MRRLACANERATSSRASAALLSGAMRLRRRTIVALIRSASEVVRSAILCCRAVSSSDAKDTGVQAER